MSDIVNNATIMITADASGVEAGLRKVDDATAKTGRNLDNLESSAKKTTAALEGVANTPGMEAAGDGAGVAAGRMDRATKNMADSIQRTLATMNAGAKGSAQYYEALANSRGLNVNALRPYLDQLDEMTKKSALAADAQRKLDDSTRFLDSLRSRTEGIGKSASELAALRAEQLGVSDAAADMIAKLREQEEAGESSFSSLSNLAEGAKVAFLAVAATVAAVGATAAVMVSDAINDLADLDGMAQKTGSSVESLSKIQRLAAVFGEDMGGIDGALTKLSRGMAGVDEDSNKVAKSLKTLGLSSRDAAGGLRDPSVVLVEVAKSLQNYRDDAGKTALVNNLIGKSGADILPFLNDLAENYDGVAGTSGAAAAAAAAFQDEIGFLKLEVKELATSAAVALAPALRDVAGAFSDVYKQQGTIKKGEWSSWADDLGLGFAKAADAIATFARSTGVAWDVMKGVRAGFAIVNDIALISPVEAVYESFKGGDGLKDVKKSYADLKQAIADGMKSVEDLNSAPSDQFEKAYRDRVRSRVAAPAAPSAGAGEKPKPSLPKETSDVAAKEAAKALTEYEALLDRINGKSVGLDPAFYDNLAKLYKGYQAGKQSLSEYVGTVEKYIGMQPFAKQAEEDRLRALKEVSDFQDSYSKGLEATSAVYAKRAQDAEDEAKRNEELASTYGLTKSAIEALELARLQEQLAQRSTLGLTLDEIENLEKLIGLKQRNAAAVAAMEQVDAAKKAAEEWKRASDSIEQSLTDALLRGFESGKGFGQNMVDTLKNMFSTLVLRPTIQATLAPVSNSVSSMLPGMPSNGVSGSTGSAGNLTQSVSSLYNSFKSGGSFEKSVAEGVQTGFDKIGLSSGSGAPGQAAQWAGRAGGVVAGYMAGNAINAGISGGYETGSGFMTAQKVGTAVASFIGGPIGGAIAGAVGGLINRAFGRKDKEVTGTALNGTFGAAGFAGSTDTSWKQEGGWFRSDKRGVDKVSVDAATIQQFTAGYDALKFASADFASTLGIDAEWIKSRSQSMSIALGADGEANKKAIADFFVNVGDTIAREVLPTISQFAKEGEGASATLERVAVNYAMIETALSSLGKSFGPVGAGSIAARERLIELSGGLEAFARNTAAFEENYFTAGERNAQVLKRVTEQMAGLGLAGVDTRQEFRQIVLGLDLATDAGARQYAALMDLQGAFAQVTPEIQEVTKDLTSYRESLTDAYNAESDAIQGTVSRMGSFASSLRELNKSALLGDLSPLSPQEKYAEAKAQYETVLAAARSGDESAQSNYSAAFNSFLTASRAVFASSGQYQADFAYVQASTAEAERWAGAQVDVGKAQLDALKLSVSGLITLDKSVMSVRDAILQMHQVMGTTAPPAPGAMATPQINMPTPVMYASYGTDSSVALVSEIKRLNGLVEKLTAEQKAQTGDIITATARAASDNADRVAGATTTAVKSVANSEQRVAFA
jgi:hypothetical protein